MSPTQNRHMKENATKVRTTNIVETNNGKENRGCDHCETRPIIPTIIITRLNPTIINTKIGK